jgi:hypothetical protein
LCFAFAGALLSISNARGEGIDWPASRLLPAFSTPATNLDCIDVSGMMPSEIDLFASLEGIVNRAQPRIACVSSVDSEGKFIWLDLHNLPYTLVNGYAAIVKYRASVAGVVVTDPAQPDTLNLATTIAGVSNLLICDPILLSTLTNSPYNLPVAQDLRGRFANKYQVYGYLYTNLWPQCTHRMLMGLYTNLHGELREYAVALKAAVVWLDPGTLNFNDKNTLAPFLNDMTPLKSIYTGWWPSEANGLSWIAQYGVPVLASDYFRNATVFGGVQRAITIPDIPPPPPLTNKVYVSLILSDGDNIQYMQHVMKIDWDKPVRGSIPIGWTASPLAVEMDPAMMNHYWNTATTNDCLISGPSGAGYSHIESWSPANLEGLTRLSAPYLQRSGLRVITVWNRVTTGVARSFATNCPGLFGLTDQSGGTYTSVNLGLRTLGLTVTYSSSTNDIISGLTNAATNWNGASPMFLAAQANVWDLGPADLRNIAAALDPNKYVVVRPDHLFMLYNQQFGKAVAVTKAAAPVSATAARLHGFAIPNEGAASAWFEWGANATFAARTVTTNLSGSSLVHLALPVSGLSPGITYHCRLVVSNSLGVVYGGDRLFTTGGRVKAWGDASLGQTNVPPGLTNVFQVACGANHGLAVKNDGAVAAWGYDSSGQTDVPAGLANAVQTAGGAQHSVALGADGSVAAWGDNSYGQTNLPPGLGGVVEIASGAFHNVALRADGTVVAWGYNNVGQASVPAALSNVVGIAAGRFHSAALKADGTVTAWGNNSFGQTNIPAGLNQVLALGAGDYHTLALRQDFSSLTNLAPAARWVADSLAGADGTAIALWTDDVQSKPATQGTVANRPRLYSNVINGHKAVRFLAGASQRLTVSAADSPISAMGSFTIAVVLKTSTPGNTSGSFYQNTGLLGAEQPNVVPDWALCLNGSQLGLGLGAGGNGCGPDIGVYGGNVPDGQPHIALCVRSGDSAMLYLDGALVAGQSGLCPAARGDYPFQIGAMTASSYFFNGDIAEIQLFDRALNAREICGLNESLSATYGIRGAARAVVAWGGNSNGQVDVPPGVSTLTAAAAGNTFNLGLRPDGSVVGWGNNAAGQTAFVPGLTNVSALAGGLNFAAALGNQIPQASDASVSGYVNHDVLITLPGYDPDGGAVAFRLLALPPAGALYQYAGGSRGPPVDSPDTVVSDPQGRLIFSPAPDQTGFPYAAFDFAADNSLYHSASARLTLNIGLPDSPRLDVPSLEGAANVVVGFGGSPQATYSVWTSTNLVDWAKIGVASEIAPARYQFADTGAANFPRRFYRGTAP